MPAVPYTGVPATEPTSGGLFRQNISSDPSEFGGLTGAAEQTLGHDIAAGGEKVFQAGIAQQEMYNTAAVQRATNAALDIGNTTLFDPKTGYLTKEGKVAADAYRPTVANIQSQFQTIRDGLANDAQRIKFDGEARRYQYYYERMAGEHADKQYKQWYDTEDAATLKNASQTSGLAYNNPDMTAANLDRGYASIAQTVARKNLGPEASELLRRKFQTDTALEQLRTQALTDPNGALERYNSGTLPGAKTIDQNGQVARESPVPLKDLIGRAEGGDAFIQGLMKSAEKARLDADVRARMGVPGAPSGGVSGGSARFDTTPPGDVDAATTQRASAVHDGLVRRGMDSETAWGFAANAVHESRADPHTGAGDMGAAHGAFMWRDSADGGKRLTNYIQQHGHLPEKGDLDEQLDHVMWELNGPERTAWQRIQSTSGGAGAKAAAISQFFERPKDTQPEMLRRAGTANRLAGSPSTLPSAPVVPVSATGAAPGFDADGKPLPDGRVGKPPVVPVSTGAAQPPVAGVINPNPPSPAEAALPDIDKIVEGIRADYPDGLQQEQAISRARSIYSGMLLATKNQRTDLETSVKDMMASAVDGHDITVNEDHIRHLLPPARAAQVIEELHDSQIAGQQFKAVQWGSPQEVMDGYRAISKGLGPNTRAERVAQAMARGEPVDEATLPAEPAEGTEATPEQYRYHQRLQNMFVNKMLARNQALATDSAGYVAQNPLVRQKADAAVAAEAAAQGAKEGSPLAVAAKAARADLFQTSLNVQEQLGVPPPLRHIMSKASAQQVAQGLMNADPSKTDVGATLDQMGKSFGPFWNQAFGDIKTLGKLPPDYQVLAMTVDPVARDDVQRMLKFVHEKGGVEKLHDIAGKANMQGINTAIDNSTGVLRDFIRSANVRGIYGNTDGVEMMKNAVRNLAAYRTIGGMSSGSSAAESAANDLIGAKYDFDASLRVPKGMLRPVENYGDNILQNLSGSDISADEGRRSIGIEGSSVPGVDARVRRDVGGPISEDMKVEAWRRVRETGKWITNENDTGAFLTAQSKEGVPYTVRRPDGKRIEFTFKDAVSKNLANPVAPVMALP